MSTHSVHLSTEEKESLAFLSCVTLTLCFSFFFLSCYSQRYETLLKDLEKKSEQHREVLASLQQEFQKAQGLAVGKVWPSGPAHTHNMHMAEIRRDQSECKSTTHDWRKSACIQLIRRFITVAFLLWLINFFFFMKSYLLLCLFIVAAAPLYVRAFSWTSALIAGAAVVQSVTKPSGGALSTLMNVLSPGCVPPVED